MVRPRFESGKRAKLAQRLAKIGSKDVRSAYRRRAPVYDATFGRLVEAGVKQTVLRANEFSGRLLEAGVSDRHHSSQ